MIQIFKITFFAWVVLLSVTSFGQHSCAIQEHYEEFISIEAKNQEGNQYFSNGVVVPQTELCFSNLIDGNLLFVDYLLKNYASYNYISDIMKINDLMELEAAYFSNLRQDSLFNDVMLEWVRISVDKSKPKDTVSLDELLNVAVKFFSITGISDEGNYKTRICVGMHDIQKTESKRQPFVEAFAFYAIFENLRTAGYNLSEEFTKNVEELYKVNLGIDHKEQLLRAQGAIFFLMRGNENLKAALIYEYEKQKEKLPWVLKL